jgi:hypothetical protein
MKAASAKQGRAKPTPKGIPAWPADKVERRPIGTLLPFERNARTHTDAQVAQIAASIKRFGFTNPVLIDDDGTILAGHARVMAARLLDFIDVPVMVATGWTDAERRAYVIADNKLAMNAGWADDILAIELSELKALDFDLNLTGFSFLDLENLFGVEAEDPFRSGDINYTRNIEAPIYQPTGDNPPVSALCDDSKTRELVEAIRSADLPDDVAAFLEHAAQRHTVFHFAKIAEFYAHAEPEVQQLMEASALIIIDFDQAIENGFVKLTKRLGELTGETP